MPKSPKTRAPISVAVGSATSTVSGPANGQSSDPIAPPTGPSIAVSASKQAATQAMAKAMPANPLKALDHGLDAGHAPAEGTTVEPPSPAATGSTLSETNESEKAGIGSPVPGPQRESGSARRRARRFRWPSADHEPGRPGLRQPEFAQSWPARADAA